LKVLVEPAMHTDLSSHLHTPRCNKLIEELLACRKEHSFGKFVGYCNNITDKVESCLHEERIARRKANFEKSKERHSRIGQNLKKLETEQKN